MIFLFERLVRALDSAFVEEMDHKSKINMLIKLLEANDNFATNFKFFGGLLPDIGL